jgi:hypothetical protein
VPNSFSAGIIISSADVNSDYNEIQSKYNAHSHVDLTQVGTITSGAWAASPIAVAYGGTGSTTQNFVDLTTNQTVAGIKNFTSSPLVPNPTTANQTASKVYVDTQVATKSTLAAGTPCVQSPYLAGSKNVQAHGLNATPTVLVGYFECLSGELNYSVGDRIVFPVTQNIGAVDYTQGIDIVYDTTNTSIISVQGFALYFPDKNSTTIGAATASKWKVVVTPYLLS